MWKKKKQNGKLYFKGERGSEWLPYQRYFRKHDEPFYVKTIEIEDDYSLLGDRTTHYYTDMLGNTTLFPTQKGFAVYAYCKRRISMKKLVSIAGDDEKLKPFLLRDEQRKAERKTLKKYPSGNIPDKWVKKIARKHSKIEEIFAKDAERQEKPILKKAVEGLEEQIKEKELKLKNYKNNQAEIKELNKQLKELEEQQLKIEGLEALQLEIEGLKEKLKELELRKKGPIKLEREKREKAQKEEARKQISDIFEFKEEDKPDKKAEKPVAGDDRK